MPNLYISLHNKFHLDICIFGLVLTYLEKNTLSRYFGYLIHQMHLESHCLYRKFIFQSLLFYAFTPKNKFLIGKSAHKV